MVDKHEICSCFIDHDVQTEEMKITFDLKTDKGAKVRLKDNNTTVRKSKKHWKKKKNQ